jgi:hypothetical protein
MVGKAGMPAAGKSDVRRRLTQRVMAGLDPAIPTCAGGAKEAVACCNNAFGDGRVKPGHDVSEAPSEQTDRGVSGTGGHECGDGVGDTEIAGGVDGIGGVTAPRSVRTGLNERRAIDLDVHDIRVALARLNVIFSF